MDKQQIVWTAVAVGILGLVVAVAITRQNVADNGDGTKTESTDAAQERQAQQEKQATSDQMQLPQAVIERVESVSGIERQPIAEQVRATIKTTEGDIEVELYGGDAPQTVGNFVALAENDFYDRLTFHRVIPGFMIQAGDPLTLSEEFRQYHGAGNPGYLFEDEINDRKLVRGSVAMANGGPDTNGSQFFIVTAESTPHLDGKHTNFGQVISGMEVVDAISQAETDNRDNPVERIEITDVVIEN